MNAFIRQWVSIPIVLVVVLLARAGDVVAAETELTVQLRRQVESPQGSKRFVEQIKTAAWPAKQTAIVICDMWDDHYCRASASRVAEMAPHMNRVIGQARDRGVLIIHCPSGCMDKYEGSPQRALARQAPKVETLVPLKNWCYLDDKHEPPLPIEDSEPCEDTLPREKVRFYTRQHLALEIMPPDAITDSAEAYYLMKQRHIKHVIVMGVHTNMCVMGRPFGIRQLTYQGMDVVLMRDMTDCMYNPAQKPYVDHFTGLDLIIGHIEKYWCPTITSADILGGKPFRFAADARPVPAPPQ